MKKWIYVPLMAAILAACGSKDENTNTAASTNAAKSDKPVVRVALEPVYPPFVQQLPSGDFEGFDVALMNEIAKRQGFQVSYQPYLWDGIFNYLNTGEADVVMGGVAITPERDAIVDFTEPYVENTTVLLTKDNSPIKTAEQVRGKKVAYQNGTVSEEELRKLLQTDSLDKTLGENTVWSLVKRVVANDNTQVDAAVGQSATFNYYLSRYKDFNLRIVPHNSFSSEKLAFAVKDGNTALLNQLNKGLAEVKADGTFDKLKAEWLDK